MHTTPSRSLLRIGALAFVVAVLFFTLRSASAPQVPADTQPAASSASALSPIAIATTSAARSKSPSSATSASTTRASAATKTTAKPVVHMTQTPETQKPATAAATSTSENTAIQSQNQDTWQIARIPHPYDTQPLGFDAVNTATRAALVNILCMPRSGSIFRPIAGSGIIIDPRGVILTNAHVAQYVLLSEDPDVDLRCLIRTGSPARAQWEAEVLYLPPVWAQEHATELTEEHPTGTGEHDYALLLIARNSDGTPLSARDFPAIAPDTRKAIAFTGDDILAASYPAELIGGVTAQYSLYPTSSTTDVKQLYTFASGTPDVLSLGGIIEAQGGSSGGAVVNDWGRLVGVITTTSKGDTTSTRDLRAISLSYIDSDLDAQSGTDLADFLSGDLAARLAQFNTATAPAILKLLVAQLQHS